MAVLPYKGPDRLNTKRRAVITWIVVAIMLCCSPTSICAHDVPRSESRMNVHGREVRVEFRLDLLELGYVDSKGTGFVSTDELDTSINRIYQDFKQHFVIGAPDPPIQITLKRYESLRNTSLPWNWSISSLMT